jgi:hypothetical protein
MGKQEENNTFIFSWTMGKPWAVWLEERWLENMGFSTALGMGS